MTTDVGEDTTGNCIDISNNEFKDGEITPPDCSHEGAKVYYKIEGKHLIL